MAIRDLGYRPYEGERLPPSNNTWVLLRHGMTRAWGSWLVKIAVWLSWFPMLIAIGIVVASVFMAQQMGAPPEEAVPGGSFVKGLLWWQFWVFVSMISVGAGAAVIAEDTAFKAFSFYFAKPVTPPQYLTGRVAAVAIFCFLVAFIPALLTTLTIVGFSPAELRLERTGVILPALLYSLLISIVVSAASVGLSALSSSRALTMTAWLCLLLIPHVIALIVDAIADWPWLYLLSIWEMLSVVGDALFKIEPTTDLRFWHALPVLVAVTVGGIALAYRRVRSAEVIA